MEILIIAAGTLITEGIKFLSEKWGYKLARSAVFLTVFVVVFAGSLLTNTGFISPDFWQMLATTFAGSIGLYEAVLRPVKEQLPK